MDHTEAEVSKHRNNSAIVRANLYNYGLAMPGSEVAYQAAIVVGASAGMAFEAARRHELSCVPSLEEIGSQVRMTETEWNQAYELSRRYKLREERLARIRNLPNPYTPVASHG